MKRLPSLARLLAVGVVAAIGILSLGCRPAALNQLGGPALPDRASAPRGGSGADTAPTATGALQLTVRWPERSAQGNPAWGTTAQGSTAQGFKAQTIPLSTAQIQILVMGTGPKAGQVLGSANLERNGASGATSSVSIENLPPATVSVEAVASTNGGETVATASLQIAIVSNSRTAGRLTLGPSFSPVITSFAPTSGPVGSSVTILGKNLYQSWANPKNPAVSFGGVPAVLTAVSATSITVIVPEVATSSITVSIDGLATTSAGPFGVTPSAPPPTPTPGPTPTPTPEPTPTPTPTPTPPPLAVSTVTVSPSQATLYVPAADGSNLPQYPTSTALAALVTYADNSTGSAGVVWSVDNAPLATVSVSGVVSIKVGSLGGTVVVTATAGSKQGSSTITVQRKAEVGFTVQ